MPNVSAHGLQTGLARFCARGYLLGPVWQVDALVSPSAAQRPELTRKSMRGECRFRCLGCRRREVEVEPVRVPVESEVVDDLWSDNGPERVAAGPQPHVEFAFRPEGRDVGSRESDVVPEPSRGHEEVHDRVTDDSSALDAQADGVSRLR